MNSVDITRFKVLSDLPGFQTSNGGSLPPSMTVTTLKPDIVVLDEKNKKAVIYEKTVPFERNIDRQHTYKSNKYAHLETVIKTYSTKVVAFEVGSRGYISKRNITSITKMAKLVQMKKRHKSLMTDLFQISLLCSFSIFQARSQPTWQEPPYLHP